MAPPPPCPPLTLAELDELSGSCDPGSPVRRLVDEIYRLHRVLIRCREAIADIERTRTDEDLHRVATDQLCVLLDHEPGVLAAESRRITRREKPQRTTKYEPLPADELREMYRTSAPGSPMRRALEEVARQDGVIVSCYDLSLTIRQVFTEETGGHLAACHHLRTKLLDERAVMSRILRRKTE